MAAFRYLVDDVDKAVAFYTTKLGFTLERCMIESNNSGYRGTPGSLKRRMYRFFEFLEERLETLRALGDTWYMAFRKNAA